MPFIGLLVWGRRGTRAAAATRQKEKLATLDKITYSQMRRAVLWRFQDKRFESSLLWGIKKSSCQINWRTNVILGMEHLVCFHMGATGVIRPWQSHSRAEVYWKGRQNRKVCGAFNIHKHSPFGLPFLFSGSFFSSSPTSLRGHQLSTSQLPQHSWQGHAPEGSPFSASFCTHLWSVLSFCPSPREAPVLA